MRVSRLQTATHFDQKRTLFLTTPPSTLQDYSAHHHSHSLYATNDHHDSYASNEVIATT